MKRLLDLGLSLFSGAAGGVGGYLIVALAAAVISFTAAWKYQGARFGEEIAGIRLDHAAAVSESLRRLQVRQAHHELIRNQIDVVKTMELEDAHAQIDSLSRAVADGSKRLRVAARCPAAAVSAAAGGAGLDHAAAPELTADARQAYFALRAGLEQQRIQLEACQDYLGNLTQAGGQ
jgi:prophage endopeptidase